MRVDDGNIFNAGWNAALEEALRRVKKIPIEKVADDGIRVLIPKPDVLSAIRDAE